MGKLHLLFRLQYGSFHCSVLGVVRDRVLLIGFLDIRRLKWPEIIEPTHSTRLNHLKYSPRSVLNIPCRHTWISRYRKRAIFRANSAASFFRPVRRMESEVMRPHLEIGGLGGRSVNSNVLSGRMGILLRNWRKGGCRCCPGGPLQQNVSKKGSSIFQTHPLGPRLRCIP